MKRAHLETKINLQQNGAPKTKKPLRLRRKKEFEHEEYYLKDNFESVTSALDLLKDNRSFSNLVRHINPLKCDTVSLLTYK